MEAVSKLAQVLLLPSPPQWQAPTPLLLEVQHLRQDIKDLRTALQQAQESQPAIVQFQQEIAELKTTLGNLTSLVRISAGPRLPEITKALQAELQTAKKAQAEIQRIVHAELEAALQLSKTRLDELSEKIIKALPKPSPPTKKGLFG